MIVYFIKLNVELILTCIFCYLYLFFSSTTNYYDENHETEFIENETCAEDLQTEGDIRIEVPFDAEKLSQYSANSKENKIK